MNKYGMEPMDTIKSATMETAKLLGIEDKLGSIESGKLADIIAVNGNPLNDLSVMEDVVFVMKEGTVYKK
jgi:imidazolonepropionase-like amidohydrolase